MFLNFLKKFLKKYFETLINVLKFWVNLTTCYKCSQLLVKSFLENVLGKFSSLSSFKSITLVKHKFKLIKNNFKSG